MTDDIPTINSLIGGYAQMIEDRVAAGWQPTLLTFMFNQLQESARSVTWQMQDEVTRVYAHVLPRIVRKPNALPARHLPLWICTPDYPVHKHEKHHYADAMRNDGRHIHAIAVVPPTSRMRQTLEDYFYDNQGWYSGAKKPLWRLHARAITDNAGYVTGYGMKGIKGSRVSYDDIFILPRLREEISS